MKAELRPTLARIVLGDAPEIELADRERVLHRIESALGGLPEKQRHSLGNALLEMAVRDCSRLQRTRQNGS